MAKADGSARLVGGLALGDRNRHPQFALWGLLVSALALWLYLVGVVSAALLLPAGLDRGASAVLVWSSGAPLLIGIALIIGDAAFIAPSSSWAPCPRRAPGVEQRHCCADGLQ